MFIIFIFISQIFASCSDDESNMLESDQFTGIFNMTQTCDNAANSPYTISISKADQNKIILQNLGNYQQAVNGTVTGDSVHIPTQNISAGMIGAVTVSGGGNLSSDGNTLEMELEVLVPGPNNTKTTSNCQIIGTRQ